MKNYLFHFVRYSILLLPIVFLIFIVTHINNHNEQDSSFASNHISAQITPPGVISTSQLQSIIQLKRGTLIHKLLPSLPIDLNIN